MMRYEKIPSEFFSENRKRLVQNLVENSVVLLVSNDVLPTNADGVFGFKQNSDLFYFTGIDQEDTALFLFPMHPDPAFREVLFIRETNEHLKVWEGEKLSKKEAFERSGIKKIMWERQFFAFLEKQLFEAEYIYLNDNEHDGANRNFISNQRRFIDVIKKDFPLHGYKRIAPIVRELRTIKSKYEINILKKAIEISKNAFFEVAKKLKDGVYEFEIEAELTYHFLKNRARNHAFQPIVASGKNACVLHYVTNNDVCKNGELLLLDFGAEYANYNADVTRCLPINGTFSERQKEVYSSVLRVLKESKKLLYVGNTMVNLRKQVGKLMEVELVKLGLLTHEKIDQQNEENPLYRTYFPHGISHHLGLDVHDVGSRHEEFRAGMVFTCEPGIYIPEEGLGIRLENDILITETGQIDLMEDFPIEIEEIELLMKSS